MKSYRWVAAGILLSLLLAAGAYWLGTSLLDSIYAYRSPLHSRPPEPGEPVGEPLTRRVVFVLIDALRLDTSLDAGAMPVLNGLRSQGAWATMHSRPPSYSSPGYSVLLTGAWPGLSDGPVFNQDYEAIPTFTQDNLFSAVTRRGSNTAVSAFNWFEKLLPADAVGAGFFTAGEDHAADRAVVDAALPWLRTGGYELVLIHLDQVDYAGHHEGGPRSPNWAAAASRSDVLLGEILAELDLQQDTLFVVSDHGQIDQGGHGGHDPVTLVEPFVMAGAGVRPGEYADVEMVDVAPTLAVLLGANLPASAQGQARLEMLDLDAAHQARVLAAQAKQQAHLAQAFATAIGEEIVLPQGSDVAPYQAAMQAALDRLLLQDRLVRVLPALLLAALPAVVLYRKRSLRTRWLLLGALVTVALFLVRYGLVDGRSFSFSSLLGADDLILFGLTSAAVALLAGWLLAAWKTDLFHQGSRRAVELTLALSYTTMYLLSLPVLFHFTWNGMLVGWALPEFASTFLAFLFLVEIMFVALVGVLLCGVAAGAAARVGVKKKLPLPGTRPA